MLFRSRSTEEMTASGVFPFEIATDSPILESGGNEPISKGSSPLSSEMATSPDSSNEIEIGRASCRERV